MGRMPVRWNPDTECFELRCNDCVAKKTGATFWPLTAEFWYITPTRHSLARCKACELDKQRQAIKARARKYSPERAEADREYKRRWSQAKRNRIRRQLQAAQRAASTQPTVTVLTRSKTTHESNTSTQL